MKKHRIDVIVPLFSNQRIITGFIFIHSATVYAQERHVEKWCELSQSFGEYLRQMLVLEMASRPR